MKKKTAVILGVRGQDGKILFDFLVDKNYSVIGIHKTGVRVFGSKWNENVDITNVKDVFNIIKKTKPDEVYHLAAFHHASQDSIQNDLKILDKSYQTNVFSLVNFLEAIRRYSPNTRIFYATSSLIYGSSAHGIQHENSFYNPDSIYGITKLEGLLLCRLYRAKYGLFASSGIFFNHESAYREKKFISRKIIQGVIDIKNKKQKVLKIGNLQSEVDWGYAPDYMEATHKILLANKPDDFVVATGVKHSVLDFVKIAFAYFEMDWKKYVVLDTSLLLRKRKPILGDAQKLTNITGWKPHVNFKEMIAKIIEKLDNL